MTLALLLHCCHGSASTKTPRCTCVWLVNDRPVLWCVCHEVLRMRQVYTEGELTARRKAQAQLIRQQGRLGERVKCGGAACKSQEEVVASCRAPGK